MERFSDPLKWRDSQVTFTGMPQYALSAAAPNKPSVHDTDLIVLGCNLNSSQLQCDLKNCDPVSNTIKSSLLTIYNIEGEASQLRNSFGRTNPCAITNTLNFNIRQHESVDHDEHFHHHHVSSHTINAREDNVPNIFSSRGPGSDVFASKFQIVDEIEDLYQQCGPKLEGSYAIKIGSCFNSMIMSLSAEDSTARIAIKAHALYPYLVSAHMDSCQVGATAADLKLLEEARFVQQYPRNTDRSSPFTKPELDSIMAWYLGMLLDIKEKVEEPFFTEMDWCDGVLEKLKLLGPSSSPTPVTGWDEAGADSSGYEGSDFKTGETRQQDYASSSFDKRDGATMEQWKQDKIVKEWLRSKHDRSEICNLRGQCKKKRRQGKHPDTAREHLVEWFNHHGEWPYPSEEEKQKLAEQTKLEARQINNWFINQRKRHWDSPTKEGNVHHAQRDLEPRREIANLESFVKNRFYVPTDVFNPSQIASCSWSTTLT